LRKKNQATIEKYFGSQQLTVDEKLDLFTDDAVSLWGWEDYTPQQLKGEGKAKLRERLDTGPKFIKKWKWFDLKVTPTLDPDKFFVEVKATALFAQPGDVDYTPKLPNRYIFKMEMQDGKIKRSYEYFDRLYAMKALGVDIPFRTPERGGKWRTDPVKES